MFKYFDKDFYKFFFGFMTIIFASLIIILVAKVYFSQSSLQIEPSVNTASN